MVVRERKVVDEERADDDHGRGKENAVEDALRDDRRVFLAWWPAHDRTVHRIDTKRLTRRTYITILSVLIRMNARAKKSAYRP